VATYGLMGDLRQLGVLNNKHVPAIYLRASISQRLALLQGLMDTDGSVNDSKVEFSNSNWLLVEAVAELATSLGQKPVITERRARLNGRDYGPCWRVTWRPTMQVFRLPRKVARLDVSGRSQGLRNHHRMIIGVERIPPTPMRCLTVDSPNSMFLCGEGMIPTHNTRTGAETLTEWAKTTKGTYAVVGPTFGDARAICVEGSGSGLIDVLLSHGIEHTYNRSLYEIRLSNGSLIVIVGADTPDRLRGYNLSGAWADEIASWRRPATWHEALMPALRIGKHPRLIATGTPKPVPLVKGLMSRSDDSIVVTRGRTLDNAANLSKAALDELIARYQGTRLGRQELDGELLEDVEGALWTLASIELSRVDARPEHLTHVCVSMDPAGDGGEGHDEHGITVSGVTGRAAQAEFYLLADLSRNCTPSQAARTAILAYVEYEADCIVYEKNQGQGWITAVLSATWLEMAAAGEVTGVMPPLRAVNAARSKRLRAEPVQALYEQGRVHHVGAFPVLETQQTTWIPGDADSPDALDSLVHGITWLYEHARQVTSIRRPPTQVGLPSGVSAAMGGQRLGGFRGLH
jgi:phage terminase large subunit-like protein